MEYILNIAQQNRKILYKFLTETPKESLLKIPENFNNNIWWNIAHVVITQQLLVYKFSNLPMMVDEKMVEKFKKGSIPDGMVTDEEIQQIKTLLFSTLEKTELDYKAGKFTDYKTYTTSVNITLNNVEEAMKFNNFHEGLHLGAILALKRSVTK